MPAIKWKALLLQEAGEREHILSRDEEDRLFAALRPDYHPMVRFALVTGVRLGNVVGLSWAQVDRRAEVMTFRVKSRKPGGELHRLPITAAVAAILDGERGRHPVRVFTYLRISAFMICATPPRRVRCSSTATSRPCSARESAIRFPPAVGASRGTPR